MKTIHIHPLDNVAVALEDIKADEQVSIGAQSIKAAQDIPRGHKIALRQINQGENIIKYGFPIGHASAAILAGAWVHTHNIATNLGELLKYSYNPTVLPASKTSGTATFAGYRRADGRVGVRNEIWIIPTVSCVNRNIQLMARAAADRWGECPNVDGIFEFTHPYGCSQMGQDQLNTQKMLANLVNHPNAAGVLIVSLGCENNNLDAFRKVLGEYDPQRVKFLVAQDVEDEIEAGVEMIGELIQHAQTFSRQECGAENLVVGLKCGGSDGFSGITANPLVGAFSDLLIGLGGSTVLTEVPEMFGAETILMDRARDQAVFEETVRLINNFKQYFTDSGQTIYENPSPGNKKGGISTLEEKSLGCTQKGGTSPVMDVLHYADVVHTRGLNLLSAPGNDMVAATALAATGCQIVLFTTGRGTPLGTAVPTVKIATNAELFGHKRNWMDYNAGRLLAGESMENLVQDFLQYVLKVASGEATKAEKLGFREIAIFKNGVTL